MISAINKASGEVIELATDTPDQIADAWLTAMEYEKAAKSLKDQLKPLVPPLLNSNDQSAPIGKFMFRRNLVQRQTYDKAVIRNVLDEDALDLVTVVKKSAVDEYIKNHREELGDAIYELKQGMIPDGAAYEVIKLERIER